MPLPLIPVIIGIASLAAAGVGIAKGAKAVVDNSEAKGVNDRAHKIIDDATSSLNSARARSKNALESLGSEKIRVCEKSIGRFISLFEQVKNIQYSRSSELDELARFRIDKQNFKDLKKINLLAISIAGGTLGGALTGGVVAFGAYGVAGTFAAASTGTAIASFSGAAATNATLAFFGGGSLATGGLGMAGGTIVLGVLVAGPALAVLGIVMGAKASANLDNAHSNLAKAEQVREEIKVLVSACSGIQQRAALFERVLTQLDLALFPLLNEFENVLVVEGTDYKKYSTKAKNCIAAALSTVQAIKAIVDTPLLDKDGALTIESLQVAAEVQRRLNV